MSSSADDPENGPVVNFTLQVDERPMEITVRLPVGEVRLVELLPVLRKFNDALISVGVEGAREQGRSVSCRAGCGACCRQMVPIGEDEAIALLEWMDTLPEEQRAVIDHRFRMALTQLEEKGMLEATRKATRNTEKEEAMKFSLDYFHAGVACPFLINESCGIYPIRPMKCREYLVTSPAENCRQPSADSIHMVELPTHLSTVLFRFDAVRTGGGSEWLPMVLLFEWAESREERTRRRGDSLELFEEFVSGFADAASEAEGATEPIQTGRDGRGGHPEA